MNNNDKWKGRTFNQLFSSVIKNNNTMTYNNSSQLMRPQPLKIYRKEFATLEFNNNQRISVKIDTFNTPNGLSISKINNIYNGITKEENLNENNCNYNEACNAKKKVQTAGMMRNKFITHTNENKETIKSSYYTTAAEKLHHSICCNPIISISIIDTSNTPIDTSNTPIDTSNTPIDTSNTPIDTSNTPIDTSNTIPTQPSMLLWYDANDINTIYNFNNVTAGYNEKIKYVKNKSLYQNYNLNNDILNNATFINDISSGNQKSIYINNNFLRTELSNFFMEKSFSIVSCFYRISTNPKFIYKNSIDINNVLAETQNTNAIKITSHVFDNDTKTISNKFLTYLYSTSSTSETLNTTQNFTNDILKLFLGSENDFYLYEFILYYDVKLTSNQIKNVEGYLAIKWNLQKVLPVNHPYKTSINAVPVSNTTLPSLTLP